MNDIAKAFAQVQQMSELSVFAQSSENVETAYVQFNAKATDGINNNLSI